MKKKNFALTLENPCHQDWDNLPRESGGLYCGDCKKVVHDFTLLSDEELIKIFTKKNPGNICGRFRPDQLNRNFVPQPEKRFSFRPVKIALLSLFTLKFISVANAAPKFVETANYAEQKNSTQKISSPGNKSISGKTVNKITGLPLHNVIVKLVGYPIFTQSDLDGNFQLLIPDSIKDEKLTIRFRLLDYVGKDTTIAETQLPFVDTVRMTYVPPPPPQPHLGGVPIQRFGDYEKSPTVNPNDPNITFVRGTPYHRFWYRFKMKFHKKPKN